MTAAATGTLFLRDGWYFSFVLDSGRFFSMGERR